MLKILIMFDSIITIFITLPFMILTILEIKGINTVKSFKLRKIIKW